MSRLRNVAACFARFVLGRLVIWGGVTLLLALTFGEFWAWVLPREQVAPSTPGRRLPPVAKQLEPGDWPHIRGPSYDGVSAETDLADTWPADGPPVLWIREIGRGYSGMVVVGSRVYTQSQTLYRQFVLCMDAETGETLWDYHYAWPYEHGGMYPGPRATPTWHAGRVYFAGPRGLVGCLSADDGRPIWTKNVVEKFGGRGIDFGYACTPLVCDGKVILPVGGEEASVVALDAEDGSTVWTAGDEPASYCGALPISFAGRPLVVAFLENTLTLIDRATGEVLWKRKFSRGYDEHASWPIYAEPHLMIATPFQKGSRMFVLEPSGEDDEAGVRARQLWESARMSNDVASSVLYNGHVYGFDLRDIQTKARRPSRGTFRTIDFPGGEPRWSSDRPGHAALLAADGKLLMLNDRGEVILARASPTQYEELGRANVFGDEICWTAPALSHGRLYLRSPTRMACLYVGKPENLTVRERARARSTTEIAKPRRWDLTWMVGDERPFPFDPPDGRELKRWYRYSVLGIFAVAAVVASLVYVLTRGRWPNAGRRASRATFWGLLAVLGLVGTPLFNAYCDKFVFTWPVTLFVAHQAALTAIVWGGRHRQRRGPRAVVMIVTLSFFAAALAYFHFCQRLDLAVLWVFLIGFVPTWPVAVPAAYMLRNDVRPWWDFLWALAGFTIYFCCTAALIAWRLTLG